MSKDVDEDWGQESEEDIENSEPTEEENLPDAAEFLALIDELALKVETCVQSLSNLPQPTQLQGTLKDFQVDHQLHT